MNGGDATRQAGPVQAHEPPPAQAPATPPVAQAEAPPPLSFRPERVPGLFCPGRALRSLRQKLEAGLLYGVQVADDWITVMRREDGLHWRAMRAGDLGVGSRGDLEAYLRERQGQKAGTA